MRWMSWWSPCTPTVVALLVAVQDKGGYNAPQCAWYVDVKGRPFPPYRLQ